MFDKKKFVSHYFQQQKLTLQGVNSLMQIIHVL